MSRSTRERLYVTAAEDLDERAVLAVAAGAGVELARPVLDAVAARRRTALDLLRDGPAVYGVSTGMGALSDTRLTPEQQADHSRRLLLARAVGGPPWLDPAEVRAVVAVRLRTFLNGDAAVSAELCAWLGTLLDHPELSPEIPRTGSGAAGEILPLAHAWAHLGGWGPHAAQARGLGAPTLGPKEGLALIAGTPIATALALLRAEELRRYKRQATVAAAGSIALIKATRDPYEDALARGDAELAGVLAELRRYAGSAAELAGADAEPSHLQAPVSFRVVGPVLAHIARQTDALEGAAGRALRGVGDSPALLETEAGLRFVGTAGFHGLDLAAAFEGARAAVVHAAAVGTARLHRLLDPDATGLPAQLSSDPGPMTGLTPLHKWAVARVHEVAMSPPSYVSPVETSGGQEDVQTFALEAAERLRAAVQVGRQVLACELLAVEQGRRLAAASGVAASGVAELDTLLAEVGALLPAGVDDRPWGADVQRIGALLEEGWAVR